MKLTEQQVKDLEQLWFTNFLVDKHSDLFREVLDDNLRDSYNDWVSSLSFMEIREFAEEHYKQIAHWVAEDFFERNLGKLGQ